MTNANRVPFGAFVRSLFGAWFANQKDFNVQVHIRMEIGIWDGGGSWFLYIPPNDKLIIIQMIYEKSTPRESVYGKNCINGLI